MTAEGGPLRRAADAVHGERIENYGHPFDNFTHIAGLWEALFGWTVTAEDVALAMVLFKLSRLFRTPGHEDSETDVAGYIETYHMIVQRRKENDAEG